MFAIVAHSSLITALQNLFALPFYYVRETMSSPTSLAVFAPFLEETSFLARLLGSIDLFQIWSTVSLAIGLGVLYKRRTTPIATSLFIVYFVIVAAIAAIRSALSLGTGSIDVCEECFHRPCNRASSPRPSSARISTSFATAA